ncbi:neuropeptide FF receptor 2-like [Tubulanus polymorphus]|uniref:neuropeptide FF receptor 2-like n=1 Tax=Tubulanus polymorphus TaxID=672921 RepID=UPI003DA35243
MSLDGVEIWRISSTEELFTVIRARIDRSRPDWFVAQPQSSTSNPKNSNGLKRIDHGYSEKPRNMTALNYSIISEYGPTSGFGMNAASSRNNVNMSSNLSAFNGTELRNNSSNSGADEGDFKLLVHMVILISVAYLVAFVLAIIGNVLVVSVVYKNPRMHTVTNYFIVNLAVADLLVAIIVLPITLVDTILTNWRFGGVMCKAIPFLQGMVVSASVNTLAAIAIDRYFAICHTLKCKVSRRASKIIIAFIWIESATIMTPWAIHYQYIVDNTSTSCYEIWESKRDRDSYFLGAIFLTCYAIPLIFITICYGLIALRVWRREPPGVGHSSITSGVIYRSKVKVVKMLSVVCVLFAWSWLPLYALKMRLDFGPELSASTEKTIVDYVVPFCRWLGTSNCSVNPLIYCFFSKKYRRGFKMLTACCRRTNLTDLQRGNSSTMYQTMPEAVNGNAHNNSSLRQVQQGRHSATHIPLKTKLSRRSTKMTAL